MGLLLSDVGEAGGKILSTSSSFRASSYPNVNLALAWPPSLLVSVLDEQVVARSS